VKAEEEEEAIPLSHVSLARPSPSRAAPLTFPSAVVSARASLPPASVHASSSARGGHTAVADDSLYAGFAAPLPVACSGVGETVCSAALGGVIT